MKDLIAICVVIFLLGCFAAGVLTYRLLRTLWHLTRKRVKDGA